MVPVQVLVVLVTLSGISNGAKILGIAGVPSFSHQVFYRPIWLELAKRGHDLTLLTTDPIKDFPSNIRQIDLHFTYHIRHNKLNLTMKLQEYNYNIFQILNSIGNMLDEVGDEELAHPDVQTLIKNESEHFDLMIMEYVPLVLSAFSVRFKCPYISIYSGEVVNFYHQALGNPLHPVLYPEMFFPNQRNLNFLQRLISTVYHLNSFINEDFHKDDLRVKKYFGEGYPPLRQIIRNVSMVFLNSHPVFNAKPLSPGFVRIGGGMHLKEKQELPQEIEKFLDSADQGAIYFSLGTNVRSNHISDSFLKTAVEVFKEIPYKIIWKLEKDMPEKSSNVKIFKWLPQQDVLRHKNIKLFITQCGAQSLEESIVAEVPLLAIPFVSDQKMNALKIIDLGLGIEINKNTMTKEILKNAILEIMKNSSYQKKTKEIANLLQDEPMTSMEKVIWWTEYVIRHKGARHFWHPNLDLPVYQYLLLDVTCFILLVLFIACFFIFKLCQFAIKLMAKFKTNNKIKTS